MFQNEYLKENGVLVNLWNDTRLIHEGKGFVHYNRHSVANNATLDQLIVTPANKEIHLRSWDFHTSAGPFSLDVYENTVVSANGTVDPVGNLNRSSTNVATMAMYHTPTVTSVGNIMLSDYAPGTNKQGEESSGTQEWVLKKNTNYLFRAINIAAGTATVVFTLHWFEL